MTDYSKITALYSRLSVGDEDRDGGESNSIQNQKIFLENYARGQHLTNIRHYIDDDESGRFFDRSAYSRMMDDVENGKIGVCIMKDLTRWGRDYLQVGKGHSLSVSDVVVLHQNGQDAAHYVDSFGYKEVPEFLQEQTQQPEKINPLKHVEDTIEQNDNSFDGIINNTPNVDELEAKVKAGEQISLVDLAEAIKADKERGKEKPSIRAQLKADKERAGKKKNAKQKSQDLERS